MSFLQECIDMLLLNLAWLYKAILLLSLCYLLCLVVITRWQLNINDCNTNTDCSVCMHHWPHSQYYTFSDGKQPHDCTTVTILYQREMIPVDVNLDMWHWDIMLHVLSLFLPKKYLWENKIDKTSNMTKWWNYDKGKKEWIILSIPHRSHPDTANEEIKLFNQIDWYNYINQV